MEPEPQELRARFFHFQRSQEGQDLLSIPSPGRDDARMFTDFVTIGSDDLCDMLLHHTPCLLHVDLRCPYHLLRELGTHSMVMGQTIGFIPLLRDEVSLFILHQPIQGVIVDPTGIHDDLRRGHQCRLLARHTLAWLSKWSTVSLASQSGYQTARKARRA